MLKKSLAFLCFILFVLPICAEPIDSGGHAGIPDGFYDDIDPNTLDNEDEEVQNKYIENSEAFPQVYENNEFTISPANNVRPTKDYAKIYNELEPADFSYLHNIDPEQYYDTKDAAWSIYPLLRLNSDIFFKSQTIEPGYYLLTPREHDGKWYILFKQNGIVKHIIPVYERDYTPEKFYDEHIPKPKLTKSQKVHMGILKTIGKAKSSKRKEPVKSYLEVNDLENYFITIIIYYGNHKYSTIFRTIRL